MKYLFLYLIIVTLELGAIFLYFIKEMSLTSFVLQTLTNISLVFLLCINKKNNKI